MSNLVASATVNIIVDKVIPAMIGLAIGYFVLMKILAFLASAVGNVVLFAAMTPSQKKCRFIGFECENSKSAEGKSRDEIEAFYAKCWNSPQGQEAYKKWKDTMKYYLTHPHDSPPVKAVANLLLIMLEVLCTIALSIVLSNLPNDKFLSVLQMNDTHLVPATFMPLVKANYAICHLRSKTTDNPKYAVYKENKLKLDPKALGEFILKNVVDELSNNPAFQNALPQGVDVKLNNLFTTQGIIQELTKNQNVLFGKYPQLKTTYEQLKRAQDLKDQALLLKANLQEQSKMMKEEGNALRSKFGLKTTLKKEKKDEEQETNEEDEETEEEEETNEEDEEGDEYFNSSSSSSTTKWVDYTWIAILVLLIVCLFTVVTSSDTNTTNSTPSFEILE